jgi:hypothetical protein
VRGLSCSVTQSRASYRRAISAASARISTSARGNTASMAVSCLTRAAMSHSSIPRLVMYRPGWSGRLPLAADLYCDRNSRPGRGTPSHHPGQVARRAGRDEATRRLRGCLARSRFHRSVAVAFTSLGTPKDTVPGMLFSPGCQRLNIEEQKRQSGAAGVLFASGLGLDLWQEKSSVSRQSGRCEQVEHIVAVLPAPCPRARAGPAANRHRTMTRVRVTFKTRHAPGSRKYQPVHGRRRKLG